MIPLNSPNKAQPIKHRNPAIRWGRRAAVALWFVAFGAVAQEQAFEFNVSGPGISGNGVIAGTSLGNGEYLINSVSGSLNGSTLTLLPKDSCSGSCFGIYPTFSDGNPVYVNSGWLFDDVLYTGASTNVAGGVALDGPGLAFGIPSGQTFNLLGNGGGFGYALLTASNLNNFPSVTFQDTSIGQLVLPKTTPAGYMYNLSVSAGTSYVLDPTVAVGYNFATGPGDPNFASVMLPEVQSTPFELTFSSAGASFSDVIAPNAVFTFPTGGVSSFTVTGIDSADGLNPSDPTAFSTVVTFTSAGTFDGVQSPIVASVSAVPEPSTYAAMLIGLALVGCVGTRRRKPY